MASSQPLSVQLRSAWAKSDDEDRSLSLVAHAADACAVAGFLYDHWLPETVRHLIRDGRGDDEARALVRWLAACHDAGKLSPAFACQVDHLADRMVGVGLPIRVKRLDGERRKHPHSVVGHYAVAAYLKKRGWSGGAAQSYAVVIGSHHGVPPNASPRAAHPMMYGRVEWETTRAEFLDYAVRISGAGQYLDRWRERPLTPQQQAVLTGVVIVADWLASDSDRFPLGEKRDHERHAEEVLAELELPPPWRSAEVLDIGMALSRFGVPLGAEPNPVQLAAVEMARAMGTHGLLLIESVMGSGKTEAALMAAEQFASVGGHGGLFVALPTMATSNAMFGRVLEWLEAHPDLGITSAMLAHGKADLNDDYRGLIHAASLRGIECECPEQNAEIIAHRWLSGNKKGMLANFVVGTIDQLLFMSLKARHLMLRHLALASKVVVVDEVHAADDYMREYLKRSLEWLAAYKVPVIMLSATLPSSQRLAYAEAYARGLSTELGSSGALNTHAYPALFGVHPDGRVQVTTPSVESGQQPVGVVRFDDDDEALCELLSELLAGGGCAAIVRNTVRRAQHTARLLREHFNGDVLLLHSGFVAQHRADLENQLLRELDRVGKERRQKRIVVATQVIEQSLDVDFDVMVSDLAPVDLLMQRIGRLHRHKRDRPARLQAPTLFVTGVVDWGETVPTPVEESKHVYEPYDLLRSIAVLYHRDTLTLPGDIATVVQAAYADPFEPPDGWEDILTEAREAAHRRAAERKSRASEFRIWSPDSNANLVGWLANHGGDVDDARGYARVRDGVDSIEVIVTRRVAGEVALPEECGGVAIPVDMEPPHGIARMARSATIRLPYILSVPGTLDRLIPELERRTARYPGWRASKWLNGELALELDDDLTTRIEGFVVRYDHQDGLIVTKEQNGQ